MPMMSCSNVQVILHRDCPQDVIRARHRAGHGISVQEGMHVCQQCTHREHHTHGPCPQRELHSTHAVQLCNNGEVLLNEYPYRLPRTAYKSALPFHSAQCAPARADAHVQTTFMMSLRWRSAAVDRAQGLHRCTPKRHSTQSMSLDTSRASEQHG